MTYKSYHECDKCKKTEPTANVKHGIPVGWYSFLHVFANKTERTLIKHFCSLACMLAWLNDLKQLKASRLVVTEPGASGISNGNK